MLFDAASRPVDFEYLNVNNAFTRLTGLGNVIGKKVTEVIPGIRDFHPEIFEIYGRVAMGGPPERFEVRMQELQAWFSVSASSTEKGTFVTVFENITDRKRNEESAQKAKEILEQRVAERTAELRATAATMQRVLDELAHQKLALDHHAIVSVADAHSRIMHANNKFCVISKYSREEILGQDHRFPDSNFHSEHFFAEMNRTIRGGQVWHGEIRNRAKDGSIYWLDGTIVPCQGAGGKPQQYISIFTDITERKLAEEEVRKLNTGLEERVTERTDRIETCRCRTGARA